MRKLLLILAAGAILLGLAGCTRPNDLQLDISQPYGDQVKLIHLNASSGEKTERIKAMFQAILEAEPTEKDPAMFAYYPDFQVTITGLEGVLAESRPAGKETRGAALTAIVDLNEDWVDIQFVEPPAGEVAKETGVIYRSTMSAKDFKSLIHVE